ncbi:MAG: hypothetical protein OEV40_18815 [Acidimicrobiia bacterium]|nr:hypothetical protein [Acidimicrobiia bacterium]
MTTYYDESLARGFATFGAIMLIINGGFHAIVGLVALVDDDFYVADREWAFDFSVTAWGWIHLIAGIILVASGFGIFSGNRLARIVGVIAVSLTALANFAWLPYQPLWSIIMILLSIPVIWSLSVHGDDVAVRQTA